MKDAECDDDDEGGLLVPVVNSNSDSRKISSIRADDDDDKQQVVRVRVAEGVDIDVDVDVDHINHINNHEYEDEGESNESDNDNKKDRKVMAWSFGILLSILFFETLIAADILHNYLPVQYFQDNKNIQLSKYILENIFVSVFVAYQYHYATILLGRRSSSSTTKTTRSSISMDRVVYYYYYFFLFLFLLLLVITQVLNSLDSTTLISLLYLGINSLNSNDLGSQHPNSPVFLTAQIDLMPLICLIPVLNSSGYSISPVSIGFSHLCYIDFDYNLFCEGSNS